MSWSRRWPGQWRRFAAWLLLVGTFAPAVLAAPPEAVKSLTVDQLDQLLQQMHGQADATVARQITGVKLTERAGAAWVAQWEAKLSGDRSREALMVIADVSAFLPPPAADLPASPAPDAQTQQQILARCRDYVKQRIPKLPDYLALRTTTSFEFASEQSLDSQLMINSVLQSKPEQKAHYQALGPAKASDAEESQYFWLGSLVQEVTYRGGVEVVDAPAGANGSRQSPGNLLTTKGEFGSVLEVIVVDFVEGQLTWDHWERGAEGALAVFHYAVPSERSHYVVNYGDGQDEFPAYHGEVAIDPESGAVWRITLLSISSTSGVFGESSMQVEFAPTAIGGVSYICPAHSVAMMRFFDAIEYGNVAHTPVPYQISINDVAFTNYHQFRSQAHIVSGAPGH